LIDIIILFCISHVLPKSKKVSKKHEPQIRQLWNITNNSFILQWSHSLDIKKVVITGVLLRHIFLIVKQIIGRHEYLMLLWNVFLQIFTYTPVMDSYKIVEVHEVISLNIFISLLFSNLCPWQVATIKW